MTLCPSPRKGTIVAVGTNWRAIDCVACRRWQCEVCGRTKAYLLRSRIRQAVYNRLITLTHNPRPGETQEEALRGMRHDWHLLQRQLQRLEQGKSLRFVAIVEWTKSGLPHLHILYHGRFIAQRKLSRLWKHIHGAPIVDIRKVTANGQAADYLCKYLTKQTECPPRMRRWSASRGFLPQLPPYINPNWPEDTTYQYQNVAPTTLANELARRGWTILDGPNDTLIALDIPPPDPQYQT